MSVVLLNLSRIATMFLSLIVPLLAKRIIDCERCALEHLLPSPAIGIDISTNSLTAAVKYGDGSFAQLAEITATDELSTLMREWAKEPIAVFPEYVSTPYMHRYSNDSSLPYSRDSFNDTPLNVIPLTREAEVLHKPLVALIDVISTKLPKLDLHHQHYALSLPPFVNRRYFRHAEQAVTKTGRLSINKGCVGHSDRTTHSMYNALFCTYHIHPLCAQGGPEDGVFDALVIDYSSSFLTITWLETFDPHTVRRGGFADGELGGRSVRDSEYWAGMQTRVAALVRSIDKERRQDDDERKSSLGLSPNQVIFLGELGADELLRSFLHDAFAGTRFALDTVTIHDSYSSMFASALSAAATAKAIMDAPKPQNCMERLKCEGLQERVYEEARSSLQDEL